ncbi:hypothetical protein ES332_A07G178300v1 [Gossypium tomentosum]|uniref:Uncharacterized protein n=1 Tax=Gossypium tomentosum TaxID=34277 RepID=A0A5D2PTR1_GOSTO|nr:hypothetical protein ES332_A07G178300v1 [Gossypium tomentosum]
MRHKGEGLTAQITHLRQKGADPAFRSDARLYGGRGRRGRAWESLMGALICYCSSVFYKPLGFLVSSVIGPFLGYFWVSGLGLKFCKWVWI